MTRSSTRILQQAIEALSFTASLPQSELLSTTSLDSTDSVVTALVGPVRLFAYSISNITGAASTFVLGDGAATNTIHVGPVANNGVVVEVFSPNFVPFASDIRLNRDSTGLINWTFLYQ